MAARKVPADLDPDKVEPADAVPQVDPIADQLGETTEIDDLDEFSAEAMWVDPADEYGDTTELLIPQIRRPRKLEWVTHHPDPAFCVSTTVLKYEDKEKGTESTYMLSNALRAKYSRKSSKVEMHIIVNTRGSVIVYLLNNDPAQRTNTWVKSARDAMTASKAGWVRMEPDNIDKAYRVTPNKELALPDPVFPKESYAEIIRAAFGDLFIKDPDHVVLKDIDARP